jgi:hypothetical protein
MRERRAAMARTRVEVARRVAARTPVGSCSAPTVRIADVMLGSPVVAPRNINSDLEPIPFAISSLPGGGSRLAWMGTDGKVYVGTLDCDDKLVGTPFSFPARDFRTSMPMTKVVCCSSRGAPPAAALRTAAQARCAARPSPIPVSTCTWCASSGRLLHDRRA